MTLSDGSAEEYDTVLAAVGRYADTEKLGLANAGVAINPKNGKLPCKFEQTNVPHVYGIGDIVDGEAELTPVAIQVRTKRKTGGGVRFAARSRLRRERRALRRAPSAFAERPALSQITLLQSFLLLLCIFFPRSPSLHGARERIT